MRTSLYVAVLTAYVPLIICTVQELATATNACEPEPMDSEDMLFILYTSGTTGKPQPIYHTQAGYLLFTAVTFKVRQQLMYIYIE